MARFNSLLKRYKFVIQGSFSLLVLRCEKSKLRGSSESVVPFLRKNCDNLFIFRSISQYMHALMVQGGNISKLHCYELSTLSLIYTKRWKE